ncbi:MAG: hypothetical protein AAF351_02390 [Pseudomonadota bacterium]
MDNYKNAHWWLLIPVLLVVIGFFPSYWLRFTEMPWRLHLHGLTATAWFVFLVVQPYLITRGNVQSHRRVGMVGLVLAGGVVLSGLNIIPHNLVNEQLPETAGYGLALVDVVLVGGFTLAVVMAIKTSKRLSDHARWMISTAFWALPPGLFRLLLVPVFVFGGDNPAALIPVALGASGVICTIVLALIMIRERRAHPAYMAAAIGVLVMVLPMIAGDWQWWRDLADAVFTM